MDSLALMCSLPVLNENSVKTSLSQQVNTLLLCNEYVVKLYPWEAEQISFLHVKENKT